MQASMSTNFVAGPTGPAPTQLFLRHRPCRAAICSCATDPASPLSVPAPPTLVSRYFSSVAELTHPPAQVNRLAFIEEKRFEMLVDSLRTSNVASGDIAVHTFEYLLRLAGEGFGKESDHSITRMTLQNPEVIPHAISLLPQAPGDVQATFLRQLQQLAESDINAQCLARVETAHAAIKFFYGHLEDRASSLHATLHALIVRLGRHRISPSELREYMRLQDKEQQERVPLENLRRLHDMAKVSRARLASHETSGRD